MVAVVLSGYLLLKGQSKPVEIEQKVVVPTETVRPSPTEAVPTVATTSGKTTQKTTVEYANKGFTPKSITVKIGTTIVWVNKGKGQMWVASAPHPAHTDLPGFDQLKSASSGGTYSYTFTKVGNWKYHSHVNPSDTGVVVVTK